MRTTFKLTRRFALILILSILGIFALNVFLLICISYSELQTSGEWSAAEEVSAALSIGEDGTYQLAENGADVLRERKAWAILVQSGSGNVIWHSEDLPPEIPLVYTLSDTTSAAMGYIQDYPTTWAAHGADLLILGHPKESQWKLLHPTFDYDLIASFPRTVVSVLLINLAVIFLIYMAVVSSMLRLLRPIVNGIEALPEGGEVYIRERGFLSELASALNRTSEKLRFQERALRKKESARANWISGVSHDIRTPLSMVMGYAGQLEESEALPREAREKAAIIRRQSIRMKNLINDLNLASKLEYHMQPVDPQPVSLVAVTRQVVADFINLDSDGLYEICWETQEEIPPCVIRGDKNLIGRAVSNLLTNAQVHNPDGCGIYVRVESAGENVRIAVEDDGVGITEEKLEKLRGTPHYMMSDSGTAEPRHGLGLLIVQQIAAAHGGNVTFDHSSRGGFSVTMDFPKEIW